MSKTLKCCGRTATSWWHRTYCNPNTISEKRRDSRGTERPTGVSRQRPQGRSPAGATEPGQTRLEFDCYHCGSLRLSCCNPE